MYDISFKSCGRPSRTNAPTIRVMYRYTIDSFHDKRGVVLFVINLPNPVPIQTAITVTIKKIPICEILNSIDDDK